MPELLNPSEKILLQTIRDNDGSSKGTIMECSNLPWSTVSTGLSSLSEKNILVSNKDKKIRDVINLNCNNYFFVGISAGTSNLKVVITDMLCNFSVNNSEMFNIREQITNDFKKIEHYVEQGTEPDKLMWCFETPDDFVTLSERLSKICDVILKMLNTIHIVSICFTFPGWVDFKEQKIVKSTYSHQVIEASYVGDMLAAQTLSNIKNNGIILRVEHNVKASAVYEYSFLKRKESLDSVVFSNIYLGYGTSIATISNGELIRGRRNQAGQAGHIVVPEYKKEYIRDFFKQQRVSESTSQNVITRIDKFEKIIRDNVFFAIILEKERQKTGNNDSILSEEELKKIYKTKLLDEYIDYMGEHTEYKQILAFYLGTTISNFIKIYSIDTFVLSGKLARLYPVIKAELKYILMKLECDTNILASENGEYSAALGAAEIACREFFGLDEM